MIINNQLDKTFGPVGTFTGSIIFIAGFIMTLFSFSALFLVVTGAFFCFTSTSALIDYDKKRVKFSNNIFGFIRIGQWIDIEPDMKLGTKKSNVTWTAYSRTNRTLDISEKDYRIVLYSSENKPIMQIKKTNSADSAKNELDQLGNQLGLQLI